MKKTLLIVMLIFIAAVGANAQSNYVELRGATDGHGFSYGYAEYTKHFAGGWMSDNLIIHSPGQEELYLGLGHDIKLKTKMFDLTASPAIYATFGRVGGEKGVMIGLTTTGTIKGLNLNAFIGHFEPIAGNTKRYTFLDSADLTKKIGKWEIGPSAGFFQTQGAWSPLVGGTILRDDEKGAWKLSVRGGSTVEVRLTRTFTW